MALPWLSVYKQLPANNEIVWIRITSIYGEIALAEYKAAKQEFIIQIVSIVVPAYQVSRWKPQ